MYIKSQNEIRNFLYLTTRNFRNIFKVKSLTHLKAWGYCKELVIVKLSVKRIVIAKLSVKHKMK